MPSFPSIDALPSLSSLANVTGAPESMPHPLVVVHAIQDRVGEGEEGMEWKENWKSRTHFENLNLNLENGQLFSLPAAFRLTKEDRFDGLKPSSLAMIDEMYFGTDFESSTLSMLEKLPLEILFHIFSTLSHIDLVRVARVSKTFCFVAYDPSLWRNVDLSQFCQVDGFDDRALFLLQARLLSAHRLKVANLKHVSDDSLSCLAFLPYLESLSLAQMSHLNGSCLQSLIAASSDSLTELDLSSCSNISSIAIQRAFDVDSDVLLKKLTTLIVKGIKKLDEDGMIALMSCCPALTSLNCSGTTLADSNLLRITHSVQEWNLTHLNLSTMSELKGNGLVALSQSNPKLVSLSLSCCASIDDDALIRASVHWGSISNLDLSMVFDITNASIEAICEHCPLLKELDVSMNNNIDDTALRIIADSLDLEEVNMYRCGSVTDVGVEWMLDAGENKSLKKMVLTFTGVTQEMKERLEDVGIGID
eukprot:TRINITY_DN1351_c1_g1_i6.p1 TRINITY_DN1351_c1_g1~~TRINITY_DN1351_c1_g1_i6.p1  ORF type:complete len:477 (-),score=125.69 TRINITY_DN1351_c1_g1_i6:58-1488(-)